MRSDDHQTDDRTRSVEIPDHIAEAISNRLSGTEFDSVDAYVRFALDQLLRELDRTHEATDQRAPRETDSDEDGPTDEAVRDRLESLGYL